MHRPPRGMSSIFACLSSVNKRLYSTGAVSRPSGTGPRSIYQGKVKKRYVAKKKGKGSSVAHYKMTETVVLPNDTTELMNIEEKPIDFKIRKGLVDDRTRHKILQQVSKIGNLSIPSLVNYDVPIFSKTNAEVIKESNLRRPSLSSIEYDTYKQIFDLLEAGKYDKVLQIVNQFLKKHPRGHVLFYNYKIICLTQLGQFDEALDVWNDIEAVNVAPNIKTFLAITKIYIKMGSLDLFNAYIDQLEKSNKFFDKEGTREILEVLIQSNYTRDAVTYFLKMKDVSQTEFEKMFHLCNDNNLYEMVGFVYEKLKKESLDSDQNVYLSHSICKSYALLLAKSNDDEGFDILMADMQASGLVPDKSMYIRLMNHWKYSHPSKALEIFEMSRRDAKMENQLICYSIALNIYAHQRDMTSARSIYQHVLTHTNIVPDMVFFNTILKGYAFTKDEEGVHRIIKDMESYGFKPDSVTLVTLLDFSARNKSIPEMLKLFHEMPEEYNFVPEPHAFFTVVELLAIHKHVEEAFTWLINILDNESIVVTPNDCRVIRYVGREYAPIHLYSFIQNALKSPEGRFPMTSKDRIRWRDVVLKWKEDYLTFGNKQKL